MASPCRTKSCSSELIYAVLQCGLMELLRGDILAILGWGCFAKPWKGCKTADLLLLAIALTISRRKPPTVHDVFVLKCVLKQRNTIYVET